MRVEIVSVEPVKTEDNGNGRAYNSVEFSYKNESGQVQGRKLVSFNFPEVFNRVSSAKPGDVFDVTVVKNGKYWNWTDIARADGAAPLPSAPATGPKNFTRGGFAGKQVDPGRFESAEERAAKQERISRQAVLNTAATILSSQGEAFDAKMVIKVAKELKTYVDGVQPVAEKAIKTSGKPTDDIPI